jgi:hypothetical protein
MNRFIYSYFNRLLSDRDLIVSSVVVSIVGGCGAVLLGRQHHVSRVQVQTDEIRGLCHQLLILNILTVSLVILDLKSCRKIERSLIKYTVERKKYVLKDKRYVCGKIHEIYLRGEIDENHDKKSASLGGVHCTGRRL